MDGERFDGIARALAGSGSRRRVLGGLLGGGLAAAIAVGGPAAVLARRRYSERQIVKIIEEAAKRFGQPRAAMLRVARCESNLDPTAVNRAGPYYGLFQFLKSTFASTPFADEDILDPKANALAAAWMWKQGRRNEWACQ